MFHLGVIGSLSCWVTVWDMFWVRLTETSKLNYWFFEVAQDESRVKSLTYVVSGAMSGVVVVVVVVVVGVVVVGVGIVVGVVVVVVISIGVC